ncbi:ATP-binding domain-containing protein [Variovorax rhizosphaerae]|uniref:ATP-binding domain-containing protein n=1 Tax=Variovorax rhizosphaerae TaxID=1836200 RepID=A0ABU8WL00_9BURK
MPNSHLKRNSRRDSQRQLRPSINSPASTGQDSCRRADKVVDAGHPCKQMSQSRRRVVSQAWQFLRFGIAAKSLPRIECAMAEIRPPLSPAIGSGQYREHDMIRLLGDALPAACTIYHSLQMSQLHESLQRFGELDVVVVFPGGHLAVLEVKAGAVELSESGVFKRYGSGGKNLAHQAHSQLQGLIFRLRESQLGEVRIAHFLLLPDFRVAQGSIGYPRERIIDAGQLHELGPLLTDACRHMPLAPDKVEQLHAFLANRFAVVPDAACHQGQRQAATRRLAQGLATWVPRISAPSGVYIVEGTAGSGKTQLALTLLQHAAERRERAQYVCFNRPLADHIARIAPVRAEVGTADEFGITALRASGVEPDFVGDPAVFGKGRAALAAANALAAPTLDMLIIDESQDFDGEWLEALLPRLKPQGRLYLMGDPSQAIYQKAPFDLPEGVRTVCPDNFRSPRRVVETINLLRLTAEPIVARGPDEGDMPGLHVHEPSDLGGLKAVEKIIADVLRDGFATDDIALVSFCGRQRSALLQQDRLGSRPLRRFTGRYEPSGVPVWTDGELLAESVYRFKGQSAPVIVVCEMDFEALDEQRARMLFVAMTRAQSRLHLVMSRAAERALAARLDPASAAAQGLQDRAQLT